MTRRLINTGPTHQVCMCLDSIRKMNNRFFLTNFIKKNEILNNCKATLFAQEIDFDDYSLFAVYVNASDSNAFDLLYAVMVAEVTNSFTLSSQDISSTTDGLSYQKSTTSTH